ncbi:MAG: DoxX family protein [Deltaproteobacteria bacterium]|nr:DoxX family protein [Deltaproteobacteria bacterium]MBI4373906.1 DoxX family protein [Deltaproteobacteria bacterium]
MTDCSWKSRLQNLGLLVLRVLIGYGIAQHGWEKMMGDMPGFAQGVVAGKMGLPYPLFFAWADALAEGVGGILLALGLLTRVAAFFILCAMGTAFFVFHAADPWNAKELAFLYGSAALSLIMTGGGCYSLDALLFCCKKKEGAIGL